MTPRWGGGMLLTHMRKIIYRFRLMLTLVITPSYTLTRMEEIGIDMMKLVQFYGKTAPMTRILSIILYTNIGENYTLDLGDGVSITYNQNTPETMVENVLGEGDWSSQINNPELGDCFPHSGIMVRASGAESYNTPDQNITDIAEGIGYLDQQVSQGRSARVHVDRIMTETGQGSNRGRHWVAISSRTTNLQTGQTTSFGFYEPGTGRPEAGTSPNNRLNVGAGGTLTGPTQYSNRFTYSVTAVRRNR